MSDQYFATLPAEEIGNELLDRIDNYINEVETNGTFYRLFS